MQIDCDFPGGNILVESIDGDTAFVSQDLRDTEPWWFYWSFRVRGAAGRTCTFRFTNKNPLGRLGPAVSLDHGATWAYLGAKSMRTHDDWAEFDYTFAEDQDDVRFANAIPYLHHNLQTFLDATPPSPSLCVEEHCTSRKGRPVPRLRVGKLDSAPEFRIILTARHHCCESIASYALEGILETMLGEGDDGAWLREHVEALVVPLMDMDGVEDGDQGKNRRPHDHNRDYLGESLYPEVAALREVTPGWSEGRVDLFLDLHCPTHNGNAIYLVGSADEAVWAAQRAFADILERVQSGPLVYRAEDNLPFGEGWNVGNEFSNGKTSSSWARRLPGMRMAATLEIPYAVVHGVTITAANARTLGHSLARAIRATLSA